MPDCGDATLRIIAGAFGQLLFGDDRNTKAVLRTLECNSQAGQAAADDNDIE